MADDFEDFDLLETVLEGKKKFDKGEIASLLDLSDKGYDPVLTRLMEFLTKEQMLLTYNELKEENASDTMKHLTDSGAPKGLQRAFRRLHEILNKTRPVPVDEQESTNNKDLVKEEDCHFLAPAPSKVKITSEKSSLSLMAHINLRDEPLYMKRHVTGEQVVNFWKQSKLSSISAILTEGSYSMSTVPFPSSMECKAANGAAKTVMPENYSSGRKRKFITANPDSKPELAAGIQTQQHRTMSVEWKTFDSEAIEELIQTTTGHLQSSFFREDEAKQSFRFYTSPPCGISYLSCGPSVVIFFAAEMVGVLHFSVYAEGCSVGTSTFKGHVEDLEKAARQECVVDLEHAPLNECDVAEGKARWTTQPFGNKFYKINRYDLYNERHCLQHGVGRGENWRRLHRLYNSYATLLKKNPNFPRALVSATLLYGEFQVAVQMPFIHGSHMKSDEDMSEDDLQDLVDALLFLGKHGFVYVDFRPPNVIRDSDKRVRLIDYDDMKLVDVDDVRTTYETLQGSISSASAFESAVNTVLTRVLDDLRK